MHVEFENIKKLLYKYSHLGVVESRPTGAILIGKAPHLGEEAWLNSIYLPVDSVEIAEIQAALDKSIPEVYVKFLTQCSNGLNILGNTLCLFGYRTNYIREINASRQPYSLIDLNKFDKPRNSTEEMFFIGGYDWDGSLLYLTADEKVHFCSATDSKSLMSWDSLSDMLISEICRFYDLFDSEGRQINESQSTLPV